LQSVTALRQSSGCRFVAMGDDQCIQSIFGLVPHENNYRVL
jgi:hypothetical protein